MACAFDVVRKDFGEQFDGELQRVATMVFQYNRFGNVGRRHVVGGKTKAVFPSWSSTYEASRVVVGPANDDSDQARTVIASGPQAVHMIVFLADQIIFFVSESSRDAKVGH